jgi:hypothetical protein
LKGKPKTRSKGKKIHKNIWGAVSDILVMQDQTQMSAIPIRNENEKKVEKSHPFF